jgi:hypothetical protein
MASKAVYGLQITRCYIESKWVGISSTAQPFIIVAQTTPAKQGFAVPNTMVRVTTQF